MGVSFGLQFGVQPAPRLSLTRAVIAAGLAAGLAATALGCSAAPPPIVGDTTGAQDVPHFADTVLTATLDGQTVDCSTSLPDCDAGLPQPGACGMNPALGPPTDGGLLLNDGDSVVVGFTCGPNGGLVIAHPDGGDLAIFSDLSGGGRGVVAVSQEGSFFQTVGILSVSGEEPFQLATVPTDRARFVRITGEGPGSLTVRAVEAL